MKSQHQQTEHVMKCTDLLALLNDYVDGAIDPSLCSQFEAHMVGCNPCQVVIDNIRQTITLYRNGAVHELPLPFRQQLHAALRERWKTCHPCPSPAGDPPSSTG